MKGNPSTNIFLNEKNEFTYFFSKKHAITELFQEVANEERAQHENSTQESCIGLCEKFLCFIHWWFWNVLNSKCKKKYKIIELINSKKINT